MLVKLFYNDFIAHIFFVLSILLGSVLCNSFENKEFQTISQKFSDDLDILKREELGLDHVEKIYNQFQYTTSTIDANKTINEIARKLETKIEDMFNALFKTKYEIERIQFLNNMTHSALFPCLYNESSENSTHFKLKSNDNLFMLYNIPEDQLRIDHILHKIKIKIWSMKNSIKQQFYLLSSDVKLLEHSPISSCSGIDHTLLWNNYLQRNNYVQKNIILLFDHGGSLSQHHFYIVKLIAKQIIASLNENDNLALLAIANTWSTPDLSDECLVSNQVQSNFHHLPNLTTINSNKRKILNRFIDGIAKGSGATNHSLGFEKALNIIQESQVQNDTVMILYISRGLLSSLTEVKTVLEVIADKSKNLSSRFIINTCAVIDENRPTIYETQFMEDLAIQNYDKFNLSFSHFIQRGTMVAINSSQAIGFAISKFFTYYNKKSFCDVKEKISLPNWDPISNDLTVTFSLARTIQNQCEVLGLDTYFVNFIEDILYFNNQRKDRFIFLTDINGRAIIHPMFASLPTIRQQLHFADISTFEPNLDRNLIKNTLLNERQGMHEIFHSNETITYIWKHINNWYIICLVTHKSIFSMHHQHQLPSNINWPFNSSQSYNIKLVYQHLDNKKESKLCRHLNQIATLDAGSLYLSSFCFKSTNSLKQIQNPDVAANYMAFLQDNTNQLENPGLQQTVKDEVAALAHILNYLRTQHLTGIRSKFIVRRYVCSYNGVLEMFPGSIMHHSFDPTKRAWFLQATEHKFNVVLIPPYLDEGGAGYIVTVAYATQHVVVAIDITYGYVFRMLLKRMPFCTLSNITCFLMDDRGYLIYHPNLIDPNGHGPVEKEHIVHKESLVASDILNNQVFIKKMLCNSYGDGTIQRFYKLNTSYEHVLSNTVQGEHCVNYNIVTIAKTNLFIGMVNATCDVVVTFCPCSIVDRLCLNCNRMEQKECECPCECPILDDQCEERNPLCNWFPEHVTLKARFQDAATTTNEMQTCFPASCNAEKTHYRCLGITGCEWCRFDVDGSLLSNPFCASMATCFNGVVGSLTPYYNNNPMNDIEGQEIFNVPISFLTVFLIVIIFLGIGFYFYNRSSAATTTNERLYLSSTQDNNLRMSDLNLSDNFHTVGGNHRDKLLQDDKPDPISPYCVSSGYRRTFLAADSDHGYSTMTQHDESEHMSLAPVELDSLEDDFGSDSLSTQTNLSLKQQQHQQQSPIVINSGSTDIQQTCIPKNHFIIVPVTVHRNKETT